MKREKYSNVRPPEKLTVSPNEQQDTGNSGIQQITNVELIYAVSRFRPADASAYCASTKTTFEKHQPTRESPADIKPGRGVVYDQLDLEAWFKQIKRHSTSEKRSD